MIHGFTGTQHGMNPDQTNTVCGLINTTSILHHGDCIGADAETHALSLLRGIKVHVHPPTNDFKRAWVKGWTWIDEPLDYLARNRVIVHRSVNGLIAVSRTPHETKRSGTWATIRYARALNSRLPSPRPIWIVWPDGSYVVSY